MDFLEKSRGPHFAADFDDCQRCGEALAEFLKTAKPAVRKQVESMMGPLLLLTAFGALLGPGIKAEVERYNEKNERKRNGSANDEQRRQREAFAKGTSVAPISEGDLGVRRGSEGIAVSEDDPSRAESDYF